ncbi:MAG: UPF0182 family protein [Dehalococcoidia bacterium]|nr:UPF0182 family protein [Dehalococcoidia bacterium]
MSQLQRDFERWFGEGNQGGTSHAGTGRGGRRFLVILGVIVLLLAVASVGKTIYTEWLWFSSLGYQSVYAKIIGTRVVLFFAAAIAFAVLFAGNIVIASRLAPKQAAAASMQSTIPFLHQFGRVAVITMTVFLSVIFGLAAQANWEVVLRFLNGQTFGSTDPVFFRDVGFYVFSLPFLSLIRGWLMTAVTFSLLAAVAVYAIAYSVQKKAFDNSRPVLVHGGILIIGIAALAAMSYWLGIWDLVYSPRGAVLGAGYTDMNAQLPAQWALLITTLLLGVLELLALIKKRLRWAAYGIGLWVVLSIVVGQVIPGLMQRLQVEPNELQLEAPYIKYNIEATRHAFGLDKIEEQDYLADPMPTTQDILDNELTIRNIRLWDHRPLLDTYNQIQSIRTYYDFLDIDVDRYMVDSEYRQVMLAARELSKEKLPSEAQTWVNQKLQFTHGYGIAMSPVNEVSPEGGLPVLWVQDIPPAGIFDFSRPQIYFGEKTNDYVIVGAEGQEFDYPMGDSNVYGSYEGTGGVPVGSLLRRALYAWEFSDFNILISGQMTGDSRLLYHRNIRERVSQVAPFLSVDVDPYIVTIDGRLVWVVDCYTTSTRYPYSEPLSSGVNYIRNSVKAVVDAYDGTVDFYVVDTEDPILSTYDAIFPGLFQPLDAMSEELRAHLRYPLDMFDIQASVYRSYHMQDPRVFYNKEDLWAVPKQVYSGSEELLEPYYIIMRLPEMDTEEFLLMLPFTPANKNNAIGWLAARCDGENYGRLIVYQYPKERLIYGPSQIENRIQQNTEITEQLALWSRGGSRVIRGNLLVIPIADSNVYVESVFLQADAGGLPELKRVIVAAGDEIAMSPTLAESLAAVFGADVGGGQPLPPVAPGVPGQEIPDDVSALIAQAQEHFDLAQEYSKQGDWARYGEELKALEAVLEQLATTTS